MITLRGIHCSESITSIMILNLLIIHYLICNLITSVRHTEVLPTAWKNVQVTLSCELSYIICFLMLILTASSISFLITLSHWIKTAFFWSYFYHSLSLYHVFTEVCPETCQMEVPLYLRENVVCVCSHAVCMHMCEQNVEN